MDNAPSPLTNNFGRRASQISQAPQTLTSNFLRSQNVVHTICDEPSQEERIAKLRAELEKLGGSTTSLESMPADMEEEFLRHVLEYETAEPISLLRLLENSRAGNAAPERSTGDAQIKLKEIIERMASLGAYLLHTNHLRSRALRLSLSRWFARRGGAVSGKSELRVHDRSHGQRQRRRQSDLSEVLRR
jgi:hypothetical protein